jgi:hypothetical protein
MARGDYLARTAGGFSPQDMNIQPASSPAPSFSSPQDMNIQPAPSFSSPQDMNIQPAVTVGFGQGQVDPRLAAAAGAGGITSTQQAQQQFTGDFTPNITQQTGGTSGFGQGTDTSGQGTDTSGQGTDTSGSGDNEDDENLLDKFGNFMAFGKPIKKLNDNDLKLILEQVKLYQEGMPNYFQGIPGGANFVKGIFNSMGQGLERSGEFGGVEGSPTLEGLEDFIRRMDPDSNMLDSFKQADPAAYLDTFGLPQTEAGLDFFANLSLDDDTVDKLTQQKIIEARERLAAARESQGGGQGITSIPSTMDNFITKFPDAKAGLPTPVYPEGYGAFLLNPPPPVRPGSPTQPGFPDQDGDGIDDRYQPGPGLPRPGIESVGPLKPIKTNLPVTFDYANIAPQFTNSPYTNQGVSPAFLENLRRFYG